MTPWYRRWIEEPDTAGKPPPLRSWHAERATDDAASERSRQQHKIQPRAWRVKGRGL